MSDADAGDTYTDEDAEWVRERQRGKLLDSRVRVLGVAARNSEGKPAVLRCYPLRLTGLETMESGHIEGRREIRGGSANKWRADVPVPWPNMLWLVDPLLCKRVGRLEQLGWVGTLQQRVLSADEPELTQRLAAAHRQYGEARWALLSDEDREYATREGYHTILRDCGVSGFRQDTQVKCLHTHTAHALAGGANPIGEEVLRLLERGEDERALAHS